MVLQLICSVQTSIVSPAEKGQILSYQCLSVLSGRRDRKRHLRPEFKAKRCLCAVVETPGQGLRAIPVSPRFIAKFPMICHLLHSNERES